MVALSWIQGSSCMWKTFVANHVSQIHEVTNPNQWRYVNTTQNPANVASRGLRFEDLLYFKLWWDGPSYLQMTRVNDRRKNIIPIFQ